MFDDLVREALAILVPAISVLVWLWASYVALFDQQRVVHGFVAVGLLLLLVVARIQLGSQRLTLHVICFLVGITAIVTVAVFGYANSESLFLFAQVILLAAVLAGQQVMWLVAVLVFTLTVTGGIRLGVSW